MRARTWTLLAAAVTLAEPQPPLHCRHERCRHVGLSFPWHHYLVDDNLIYILYNDVGLTIQCHDSRVLESPALPRAEPALRVSDVELRSCPLPRAGSLADTLAALRVSLESDTPHGNLTLSWLPAAPPLAAQHFAGLDHLAHLKISGVENAHLSPERGFLAPLHELISLKIQYVELFAGALDVPSSLRELDMVVVSVQPLPALDSSTSTGWTEPLVRCDSLRVLNLGMLSMDTLPDGWLVNCSHLEVLEIMFASRLTVLPPKLLIGASALTQLTIKQGSLETLPESLLDYSPHIRTLRLHDNQLRTLPRGLFKKARRLLELDLSKNRLESGAMVALAPLDQLTELNLANNPLGDICGTDGYSPLRNSSQLRKLYLGWTAVTRICLDWQKEMKQLETLDLTLTKVSKLSFKEVLQFTRTVAATVVLPRASATAVKMTREDYENAARGLSSSVSVQLFAAIKCDCRMYWTRRAMDLHLPALRYLSELSCSDGRRLRDVPLEDMVCPRPKECAAAALPAACSCAISTTDHQEHDQLLVRVRCENASLTRVPRPAALNHSTERLYELLLAHNNIAVLQADDLQNNIKGLDLRHNSLWGVDEEVARRLGDIDGMLRLAGNPLECSCRATPLLRTLHARSATLTDLRNTTCRDGSPLDAVPIVDCSPDEPPAAALGTWLAGGLAALLALVAAVTVCLASRQRRFFALAVLHRWGCTCAWSAEDDSEEDDERPYDLFVTFSHVDMGVVRELVARLEPPYRLCVHYRDWTPGRFISEQVVESVRESRRTVALVSRHFLASTWPRAEFREAHAQAMLDARPRLIVVLLEEPAELQLDDQLHLYIATHTYLRWGEPYFWDKLAVALPRPRAPRAPPGIPLMLLPAPRIPPAPSPGPTLALLPAPRPPTTETEPASSTL